MNAATSADWLIRVQKRITPRRRPETIRGRKIPPLAECFPLADGRFSPKAAGTGTKPGQSLTASACCTLLFLYQTPVPTSSCRTANSHHLSSLTLLIPFFCSFFFSSTRLCTRFAFSPSPDLFFPVRFPSLARSISLRHRELSSISNADRFASSSHGHIRNPLGS